MTGDVRIVPAREATDALRELIVALRGGDSLLPLTVVVPSALSGATLRRGLFPGGVAGVRFTSLPQYVDGVLTAAGRTTGRRTGAGRRALVSRALHGSEWDRPPFTMGTLQLFDALFAELDEADLPEWEVLGVANVFAAYRSYRALLAPAERQLPADRALALLPADGEPVVLHLPRRLTVAELRFWHGLGGRAHAILGMTGDEDGDRDVEQLAASLAGRPVEPPGPVSAYRSTQIRLSVDIDAEEEVRQAVRQVIAHLAEPSCRADRVALTYRSTVPYARLLHEQLTAAGLPHHVPRQRCLAQSVAGSALLGLLALPDSDFSRPELARWWASAPLRSADGERIVATRWDRLCREAGVTRGRHVWARRLQDALSRAEASLDDAEDDADQVDLRHRNVEGYRSLLVETDRLFGEHDALLAASTWAEASERALGVLAGHLGGSKHVGRWQRDGDIGAGSTVVAEQDAYASVSQLVAALARLDESSPYDGFTAFRHVLDAELTRPVRDGTGLGRGVLVAPLSDFVGADLDLVVVLGMAEGSFPPRARENPLLGDDARLESNGTLRTTADRRRSERRDFHLVLAAAPTVVLSYPAADLRSRRATHPAPWYCEQPGPVPEPMSFTQRTAVARPVLHGSEYDVQLLLQQGSRVTKDHPLTAALPALARGLDAVHARSAMAFGPWTGQLGPLEDTGATSASGLQKYATCPQAYFLSRMLKIKERDDPEDEASPLDVGTVVHAALEEFFGRHLGRSPAEPWTEAERLLARELLDKHAEHLADQGKAGRPLVWANTTRRMRRSLRRALLADDLRRRSTGARPAAVELRFGLNGAALPPVEVELSNGRTVSLSGAIDRVDVREDGGLTVLDWKTGKKDDYDAFSSEPPDLVDRGRRLQLPLYAEAALAWHGIPAPVEAYYVFVDHGAVLRGGAVDDAQRARLHDALRTLTTGVADGLFPMNPGEDGYFGWKHCGFCAFDRLCPASRGTQWDAVRRDPSLTDYVRLTEPDVEAGAP